MKILPDAAGDHGSDQVVVGVAEMQQDFAHRHKIRLRLQLRYDFDD